MPTAGTLSELASFPDSRLRILNAENGLLIMMGSLDRVLAHYGVIALRVEGVSISAISRIKGIAWNTVARWLEKAAQVCRRFNHRRIAGFAAKELQANDIRTFVDNKKTPSWASCPKMRTEPKSRILEAFSRFRGDQPTRHWLCDRRPGAELSFRPFVPSSGAPELLCSVAVVIAEQAAQSLTTSHLPVGTTDAFFRFEQCVPEPLIVALSVIMMDELSDGTAQRWLTEEDHPLQALALDRQNKPFDVSVQIRRTVRQPHDVRFGVLKQVPKLRGELLVAVHDEESLAAQKSVEWSSARS